MTETNMPRAAGDAAARDPDGCGMGGENRPLTPKTVVERYRAARESRSPWETHWQDCYDYALPQRADLFNVHEPGAKRTDKLFDGTAPDAVDQLAASLLGELTPPWARWFGLAVGPEAPEAVRKDLGEAVEASSNILQGHFDRSNFAVEMHQCYLDLVVAGTASLLFEEAPIGEPSAFRFKAVPLSEVVVAEGPNGRLEQTFRRCEMTLAQIEDRFPRAGVPPEIRKRAHSDPDTRIPVIEAIVPDRGTFAYMAVIEERNGRDAEPAVLREGRYRDNPFINFRWQKAPSETYGRSPVMKVLPDIKTLNKVVELMLKNASIAVTGIWQADDDGVLNPATISLTPGTIIPKAVGSAGLQPLDSPGRIDLSERLIEQLRANVRRALLNDKLSQPNMPTMTATEVLQRAAEMGRLLGATFGRLQAELLTPMISRAIRILIRRGEIADLIVDGRTVEFEYRSPLARYQTGQDAGRVMTWIQNMTSLGPEAIRMIDATEAAKYFAKSHGVPQNLIKDRDAAAILGDLADALQSGDLDLEEIVRQAVPVLGPMLENLGLGLKDADPETASPTGLPNNPPDSSSPADPLNSEAGS